ncbi:TIGR02302 family protein [Hyphomicrobium sp.]|uniref:TIGR02302 family protein n=1 Tax=Hyphomicrobium sp. TaxID=82 RepID=UPI002D78CD3E|nr:TIGR02302 family protein [Hyphomicrobium sp.]HET6388330.1 TIGR02302 family protein [Hyphomicrobium sp.]
MVEPQNRDPGPEISRSFARKVRLSTLALFFERLWPRLWLLIGVALVFAMLSFLGVWPYLDPLIHKLLLAAFGLGAIAAIVYAARIPWPTRDEAIRRIERRSNVPHRPATSYEDTLTSGASDATTTAIWQAHRERLARAIARLRVGRPAPRTDRLDPWAVRGLLLVLFIPIALLATGSLGDRLAAAFRFGGGESGPPARVDAWVTPPPYTALPPVLLADGSQQAGDDSKERNTFFEVPDRSLLTLRGSGFGADGLSLEVLSDGATAPVIVPPEKSKNQTASSISETRYEIRKSARIRAISGTRELGAWTFDVIPDALPKIALSKDITGTPRGSMRVFYKGEDDYGLQSAEVKVRKAPPKPVEGAKAWAQPPPLTGPRLPLERPPVLSLKIPRPGAKTVDTSALLDIGEHPWAGQRVQLWLEATDVGGQVGRSQPIEIVLPSRRFKNPLARAVVEQRRKLAEDSRNRPKVVRALEALTMEPEGFIEDNSVYLGLRSVYHRLDRLRSREVMNESINELWQIALKIEDGALSQAERAMKDAQDRLSDAIEKGDDKEIQDAMAELKKRLNDYLSEMQKNAEKENPSGDQQQEDQPSELGQQDLDQMMKDLEKSAREGSRDEAERMLSEMRELMDRLQASNSPEARAQQKRAQEMMKKLNELSDLTGKQQQLMDETFGEQRRREGQGGSQEDQDAQGSSKPGKGQKGQKGQGQQGSQGDMHADQEGGSDQGEGQQGSQGKSGGQQKRGKGSLQDRQAQLREQLDKLKKDLEEMGAGDPDKLGGAQESMEGAEEALKQGDLDEAANQQGQALEQMRQSAQQMAEQMQKNAQQRLGRGGNSPRDPMGRPQRAQGPDLGTSVKVPDAIDAQRAREILEELRKRSGESRRPQDELDYIDRLLKRF